MVLQLTSCPFRTAVLMPNLKYIVSHESYPFRGQKSEAVRNKQWQDTTPQLQEPKCKQRRPAVFFVRISFYIGRFFFFFFFFFFLCCCFLSLFGPHCSFFGTSGGLCFVIFVFPVCLFVLRFYGPVNPMGSRRARSVYLTTRLLGRLVL